MDIKHYLRKLKKELSGIGYAKRKEIIKEIEGTIAEKNLNYDELMQKFGTPTELAQSYMEGITPKKSAHHILSKTVKIILIVIGVLTVLIIAIFAYFKNKSNDEFDYSLYNAQSVAPLVTNWKTLEVTEGLSLKTDQAKLVIYFDDTSNVLHYSCKTKRVLKSSQLDIAQDFCYFIVPNQLSEINVRQSQISLIEPKKSLSVDSNQSSIRFSGGDLSYNFNITKDESEARKFQSVDNDNPDSDIKINFKLYQSTLKDYQFDN